MYPRTAMVAKRPDPPLEGDPTSGEPAQIRTDPGRSSSRATLQADAVRGSLWTAVQGFLTVPFSIVVNVFVARSLSPSGYGGLSALLAAFSLASYAANVGINDAVVQFGAQATARGKSADVVGMARRSSGYHLLIELPIMLTVLQVLLRHATWEVRAVAALAVVVSVGTITATALLNSMSRTSINAQIALASGIVAQLAVLGAAVSVGTAGAAFSARLLAVCIIPLLGVRALPRELRHALAHPLLPRSWPTGFVKYAVRTCCAGLLAQLVFSRCEIFVLQGYGQSAAAGIFALAFGLSGQISAPLDAILGPMVPATAGLLASGQERARAALLRGLRLSSAVASLLLSAGVPALVCLVPLVYGGDYERSSRLLIPLAVVSFMQSVLHPVTAFLYAAQRVGALIAGNLAALVLDVGLALVLVPHLGATGAVVANTVGQLVTLVVGATLVRHAVGTTYGEILVSVRLYLAIAATSAVAAGVAVQLSRQAPPLAVAVFASVLSLAAAACVARVLPPSLEVGDLLAVQSGLPTRLGSLTARGARITGLVRTNAGGSDEGTV